MDERAFDAIIQDAKGGGAYVDVPFDVEQVYGRKRVPILATIDGEPYRGTLVRMGGACHMLIVRKEIRQRIGKGPGDTVHITLVEDSSERVVTIPDDLAVALAATPAATKSFEALSYTHRKEYVQWITEAKRAETRSSRVAKTVHMLLQGEKTPR